MSARIVYVMGPSGAGKDSLLAWLLQHLPPQPPVHMARRTVTRAVHAGDEQHESVTPQAFAQLREAGAFAFDWHANGLDYGVRNEELRTRGADAWVIVSGSRAYLSQALVKAPHMKVVYIGAGIDTLRRRLLARGRENPENVEARVQRAAAFHAPPQALRIDNDGELADAGGQLLRVFERLTASDAAVLNVSAPASRTSL
ncbi:MAG: phosphonate metabolism protein/1,5-bisphosphokinase (PRPP-forming) PhnN [Variovorax sp.]